MCFALGQEQEALDFFEKAIEDHDPMLLTVGVDPIWKTYRNHPEIQRVLNNLGKQK